jgi:uncharacterized protein (TIRG00374 family)
VKSSAGKKIALLLLKFAVSGALLTYILRKSGVQNIAAHIRKMDPWYFLASCLVYVLIILLTSVRWGLLLGGAHRTGKLFSLCLIGSFFNHLLPGAVGGDAVKIYYLFRETKDTGKIIASVFMDRYIGYSGLLSIGLAAGLAAFGELSAAGIQWVTPLLFGAFLLGSLVVLGARIGRRFSSVANFYDYVHDTLRDRPVVAKAYAVSLAVQSLMVFSVYLIARSIGQHLPLATLFVFVPIILTVMAIPISISGLGIRESAFVMLFGLSGIPAEVSTTISFLWFLSMAAASLIGLGAYLRHKRS